MFKKENFDKIFSSAEVNIKFIGLLGFLGFPTYYFVWNNIFPQHYENLPLRLIDALMFAPYIFYDRLPNKLRQFFPLYFCITLTICLPFSFCFMLLKNHFSEVWAMSMVAQSYLLIILLSDWKSFLWMSFVGIVAACLTVIAIDDVIMIEKFRMEYLPVFAFALCSGVISIYKKDEYNRQKLRITKSIAGSIAHEIRNPLGAINLIRSQIEFVVSKFKSSEQESQLNETGKELIELTSKISSSIKRANNIINITLRELKGEELAPNFTTLNCREIVLAAIEEYAYNDESERRRIKNQIEKQHQFNFSGDENLIIYVLFNLIKNSLYYSKSHSDLTIKISSGSDESANYIYFEDNGPGIPKDIVNRLFGEFVTSGKKGGTGLGLAFCKRVMLSFGGDITCESKPKEYTKFILSFPKLSSDEYQKSTSPKKQILLIDDNKTNLLIAKKILEKDLNVFCDLAENGAEALDKMKDSDNTYDLIITDLEMPIMDGYEMIAKLRRNNTQIPVIVYSSLQIDSTMTLNSTITNEDILAEEARFPINLTSNIGADEYLSKPQSGDILLKVAAKWIGFDFNPMYKKSRDEIAAILQNKKILIADDEETNSLMLSKYLSNFGVSVSKVKDGKSLIDNYIKNFDHYDLIISDIAMFPISGDEAIAKIRNFETEKNLPSIPIIAFTGDSDRKRLNQLFRIGFNDFFIKGDHLNKLAAIAAFWIKSPEK